MAPMKPIRPAVVPVPLVRLQKAVRSLPILRSLFWVPEGCLPDLPSLVALGGSRPATSETALQEVTMPEPHPSREDRTEQRLFVATLAPGKVVGDALLVVSSDDLVAGGIQGLYDVPDPAGHWILRRCRYRPQSRLEGAAVLLAAAAGQNYYHWLFESLPRLRLLQQAGCDFSSVDHFLLNQHLQPFHGETLDRLGIPARKRRCCSKARVFMCDRLIVPSPPAPSLRFPLWVLSFLRESFLPIGQPRSGMTRLYISRRSAARRKVVNEAELEALLHRVGFKTVCLEEYSFAQQVGLFACADVVVAVHGAGLSNLVFSRPGITVIEMVAPTFINHCYQKLAAALQLNYTEIIGQLLGQPRKRCEEDDVLVAPTALRKVLEQSSL
jgi:capsular polysaccharide biosynthesis protein